MSFPGYTKVISYTKFEHFAIILFELCSGQTDKQTNKQTDLSILSKPTDSAGMGNKKADSALQE